ncbi:heparinase II/III domain-containing protein [Actinoplanes regularis]|uniref:heparinase II/III domain-containing protein n=1 Tax=Actinoplanes regularis TaxID=52697 RepID=UPI002556F14F|nr:hypothetical protein [Actinoplanes regularis]
MRIFQALVTAVLAAGVVLADPLPASADDPHVMPLDPVTFEELGAILQLYVPPTHSVQAADPTASARCGPAAPEPVPDGEPIVVTIGSAEPFTVGRIAAATWRNPPVKDPSWRLNFQGLMWMRPLARRAAQDGQSQSLAALVTQAVDFHRDDPDPETSTSGWDEGSALRRLETESCLYSLTQAVELIPGMTDDAAVLLGSRYYGPPNAPVHNHGLMANLQLVRAGDLLGMSLWTDTAVERMAAEAPLAFSRAGLAYEQSSGYQGVNAALWERAAAVLGDSPGTVATADELMKTVAKAWVAYSWETEPDGKIVQIGDSEEQPGQVGTLTTPRVLRDDQTGHVIGRWSWTDPLTSYYTVRYGPPRRAHGHEDRAGGVTWTAMGTRVLVGPGKFTYDKESPWYVWMIGPTSHNVAVPDKGTVRLGRTAKLTAAKVQAPAHAWTFTDTIYNTPHTRNINVNRDARRIRVSDSFPKAALWRQHWHLAPGWTQISGTGNGTTLTFGHPSGRKLTVTTTGRVSGILEAQTNPINGWHFPTAGVMMPGPQIVVRSYRRSSITTFTIK